MSEPKTESRVIKKYPNRRLYDTVESRYITLADIRRLVMDKVDFLVIDKKSQEDITRSILLQVIAEQEHAGEPLMSQDFLSQVIRSYGGAMQNVVGSYLEQSLKMLSTQQQQIREHLRSSMGTDAYDAISSLTQKNIERWRSVQDDIFKAMCGGAKRDEGAESERRTDGRRASRPTGPARSATADSRSGRVDVAHAQADAALPVDLEHLHAHDVAFLELVADALDALVGDLRDVHQAVLARQDRDERAEVHEARDLAFVDPADFDVGSDQLDAPLRFAAGQRPSPTRSSPCRRSRCRSWCRSLR